MKNEILLSVMVGAMGGCASGQSLPKYSVAIINESTNAITQAHVRYGEFESVGGTIQEGGKAVHNFVPFPIPEMATVAWTSSDGVQYKKEVQVAKTLPKRFTGEIDFQIRDGGEISVTNQPFFEMPKNWRIEPR